VVSSTPERQDRQAVYLNEETASPEDRGWVIATVFVGGVLVLAILFTVYLLAWDGANT